MRLSKVEFTTEEGGDFSHIFHFFLFVVRTYERAETSCFLARDLAKIPTSVMRIPKISNGAPIFSKTRVQIAPHKVRTAPNRKIRSYVSIVPPLS